MPGFGSFQGTHESRGGMRDRWRVGSNSAEDMTALLATELAAVAAAHPLSSNPADAHPASAAARRAS